MITENHIMESLSRAYVQVISARAGMNLRLEKGEREFDYGVDGTFHPVKKVNGKLADAGFPLDFQLKATADWKQKDDRIVYRMDSDAYNKIVDRNVTSGA